MIQSAYFTCKNCVLLQATYTIKVNPSWRTSELTTEAVQTWEVKSKLRLPTTNPDDYVLKGPGKEFIVGDDNLIHSFTVSC